MTAIQLGALSAGAAFSAGGLAASEAVEATLPRIAGFLQPFLRSPPVRLSMGLLTVKQFAEIRGPNDPRVVGAVLGFGATAGELDAAARAGLPIARDVFGVLGNSARSSAFMFMGSGSIGGGGYIPLPSAGAAVEGAAETGVVASELEGVESVPQTGYVPMPAEGSLESVGVGDAAEGAAAGEEGTTTATADVRKFSDYVFKEGADHGKDAVFESLGYTQTDSATLAQMWEEQAAAKFEAGDYTLGKLDQYGQRINIEIEIPGVGDAVGKVSYMRSGWMIQPDGTIKLNTPFTGFTR